MMQNSGIDLLKAKSRIIEFIRDEVQNAMADGAVIGISGGIDSAVTAYLTVQAIGNRRVLGLIMPDSRITPQGDVEDAIQVAKELGINYKVIDIAQIHSSFMKFLERNKVAEGNLRARIRMSLLYYFANVTNSLVVGTGDRSEMLLGYFCFDDKTRAVTTDGVKQFHQLKIGDEVYALDRESGLIRTAKIRGLFSFDYNGSLCCFDSEKYSLSVTPNHRMLFRNINDTKLGYIRAERIDHSESVFFYLPYLDDEVDLTIDKMPKFDTFDKRVSFRQNYNGPVWCASVARYENLLIERNGRLAFSGNTKYGDGGVDILPIGDLYKSEVRALAEILGVNRSIIQKQSSPRLWEAQTAEDELGLPYSKIDKLLNAYFDMKLSIKESAERAMVDTLKAENLLARHKATEHKRRLPKICFVREI